MFRESMGMIVIAGIVCLSTGVTQAALVAHYELDEASGTTLVDSFGGFNGTYNGSPALNQTGVVGTAVNFDPRAEDATVVYNAALNTTTFAVSFWFNNPTSDGASGQNNREDILGTIRNAFPSFTDGWSIGVNNLGQLVTQLGKPGGSAGWYGHITDAGTVSIDEWYHVVLTHDATLNGGTTSIFVNGQTVGGGVVANQAFSPNTANPFVIGHDGNGTFAEYSGLIDDVRLYNNALTVGDALALYNAVVIPAPGALPAGAALLGLAAFTRRRRG